MEQVSSVRPADRADFDVVTVVLLFEAEDIDFAIIIQSAESNDSQPGYDGSLFSRYMSYPSAVTCTS